MSTQSSPSRVVRHGLLQLHNLDELLQTELGEIIFQLIEHQDEGVLTLAQLEAAKAEFNEHGHPDLIQDLIDLVIQHRVPAVRIY